MQQIVTEMVDLTNKLIKSKEKEQASKAKREMAGNDDEEESEDEDDDADSAFSDDSDGDNNDGLGFVEETKDEEAYGSDSDDDCGFDLTVTMDCITAPVKTTDDVQAFRGALHSLSQRAPVELRQLIDSLPEKKRKFITEMFQTKSIKVGEETTARRIVTVKRKAQPEAGNVPQKSGLKIPERK